MNAARRCLRRASALLVLLAAAAAGAATPATPAAPGRLAAMQAAGAVRVCIWPDQQGISYRDPYSGELSGLDITLSAAFAAELGLRADYVDSTPDRLAADLAAGRCDIAMSAIAILRDRLVPLHFSLPYLHSDLQAVTTLGNPRVRRWADIDHPGHVVAVQPGATAEPALRHLLRHAELRVLQPPRRWEQELLAGRADAFVTDAVHARHIGRWLDWTRVVAPDRPVLPLAHAYAVAPGDEPWLQRVNRFVADIRRDGRLLDAARRVDLPALVARP